MRHSADENCGYSVLPAASPWGGNVATYMRKVYSEPVTRNRDGSTGKAIPIATVRCVEVLRVTADACCRFFNGIQAFVTSSSIR